MRRFSSTRPIWSALARVWDYLLRQPVDAARFAVRPQLWEIESRDHPGETFAALGLGPFALADLFPALGMTGDVPLVAVVAENAPLAGPPEVGSPDDASSGWPSEGGGETTTSQIQPVDTTDGVEFWEPVFASAPFAFAEDDGFGWEVTSSPDGAGGPASFADVGGVMEAMTSGDRTPSGSSSGTVDADDLDPQRDGSSSVSLPFGPAISITTPFAGSATLGGMPITVTGSSPQVTATAVPDAVWVEAVDPSDPVAGGVGGFRVWRTGTDGDLVVNYRVGGDARPGADYRPLTGRVVISDGNRVAAVTVHPETRDAAAGRRTVQLAVQPGTGYTVGNAENAAVRLGRFGDPVAVSVAADAPAIGEQSATGAAFTFTRIGSVDGPLTVRYTVGGTAEAGADYRPLTGTVRFEAGRDRAAVWVDPIGDAVDEGAETVTLTLAGSTDFAVAGTGTAALTILDGGAVTPPAASLDGGPDGLSSHPVRYWDGLVIYESTDLNSDGYGHPWAVTRSWFNTTTYAGPGTNGNGWVDTARPRLVSDFIGGVGVVEQGSRVLYFDPNGSGGYAPRYFNRDQLAYDSSAQEFVLTDPSGNQLRFWDFNSSLPTVQQGQLKKVTDRFGNVSEVTTWTSAGTPGEVQRAAVVGGSTVTESFLYEYVPSGVSAGRLAAVTYRRKVGTGSWGTVRKAEYTYYDGTEAYGTANDLKLAVVKDAGGSVLDTEYYRYYTSGQSGGYAGGLRYALRGDSYARLAAVTNPLTASDSTVAPYADHYFEYDANRRATKEVAKGAGNAGSQGGQGTFTFAYTTSLAAFGMNDWRAKTVETLPDGNQNIVYTNSYGAVLLRAYKEVSSGTQWVTAYQYDSQGKLVWTATPAAVTGYSDSYPDLLDFQLGVSSYLRDDAGLFATNDYYTSTTATSSTPGGVSGYLERENVRRGELGTAVPQVRRQYLSRTDAAGTTIYPTGTGTVYRNDNGTGGQTTTYSYTWSGSGFAAQSVTATYPAVTIGQNGDGSAAAETIWLDAKGYPVWHKDAGGFLHYRAYDVPTGGLTKAIDDVNTANTGDFTGLPSGWSTPSGGGAHVLTAVEVDALGRATKTTAPSGSVTYRVFNDPAFEERTYRGWDSGTNTPTGPTEVVRVDRGNGYAEVLTMTATPAVSGGRPTGGEAVSGVQSITRVSTNGGGQVVSTDAYFNLSGLTYSTGTSLGTLNTHFYRTTSGYDDRGRADRTVSPTGTVYRTAFDGQGRAVSEWVGLDDTPTSGNWSPTNTAGTDLVKVREYQYDGGGVGNGNPTLATEYPGGGATARQTAYYYDWRDRLVATKEGVEASEGTAVNRPLLYLDLDNIGNVTQVREYDADAVTPTVTGGVPQPLSGSLLRGQTAMAYDEWGREYKTETFSVDPSTGSVSTAALTTQVWYDHRSNPVKRSEPGGRVVKAAYDGVGRPTTVSVTDGGGDTGYSDADDTTGDAVLEQTEYGYDANGNVTQITRRQRFHDETGTGPLGTPATGVKARVSYAGFYYDKADRRTAEVSVGTNGGSAWAVPTTVPTRSDTALVTSYAYDAAGRVESVTDPRGLATRYTYDALHRVTQRVENHTGGSPSDTADKTTQLAYNGNGQLTSLSVLLTAGGSQTTEWVYGVTTTGSGLNSNDLLAAEKLPDPSTGAASASEQQTLTVNALGETTTLTDRNGSTHTYTYDVLGRLVSDAVTTLGSGVDGTVRRVEIAYDGQGNPYQFTQYDAASGGSVVNQVKREFNGLAQVTSEWQEYAGAVGGSSVRVQYGYSAMAGGANHSRPTTLTYPNGKVLTYNYASGVDAAVSRLSSLSDTSGTLESFDYLGDGTVVRRGRSQPGVDLTYVKQSGESNGDAGDQYTGLDRFGRVTDQWWRKTSGGTHTDRFQYGYDRDSNRTYRDNLVNTAFGEVYAYDGLNQVTSFERGTLNGTKTGVTGSAARSQGWDYDAVGNWESLTTNGTAQTRTHNRQNEITGVGGATTPTFDASGNLTKDQAGQQYVYDAWDRLVTVKDAGGTTIAAYQYDPLGRRARETRGGTTTDLYYSTEWQVLEERVGGATKAQYVWSPVYVDALMLRDRDTDGNGTLDERLWVQQDANGNVTALVDGSGAVVERYVYDQFGAVTVLDGSWAVRAGGSAYGWVYLFQGLRYDPVTGLYHARHRDLHPTLGRPLQRDPLGYAAGDVNVYRWEGNTPANVTDPSGLMYAPIEWAFRTPTEDERLLHFAMVRANSPRVTQDFWGNWRLETEDPDYYKIYGGQQGGMTAQEALDKAKEEIVETLEEMFIEVSVGILVDRVTPGVSKLVGAALKRGWKLVKNGNKVYLKQGKKLVEVCKIGCFAAGTPLLTPDGFKLIEEFQPGDLILTRHEDEPDGPITTQVVNQVFRRHTPVMRVVIRGREILLTDEHPFFTVRKGWTPAFELVPGDLVRGDSGKG